MSLMGLKQSQISTSLRRGFVERATCHCRRRFCTFIVSSYPWDTLGVGRDCSLEEAKLKWRQKIKEVHPDLHQGDPEKEKETLLLNQAYVEIVKELSLRGTDSNLDVFDVCQGEPDQLFINPMLCYGVSPMYWSDLVTLAQDLGEVGFTQYMYREQGIRVPDEAFVYVTRAQYEALLQDMASLQTEVDIVGIEAFEYFLIDCLSRAKRANR